MTVPKATQRPFRRQVECSETNFSCACVSVCGCTRARFCLLLRGCEGKGTGAEPTDTSTGDLSEAARQLILILCVYVKLIMVEEIKIVPIHTSKTRLIVNVYFLTILIQQCQIVQL